MTQADDRLSKLNSHGNAEPEDDMLPEYDLSQLGKGVRGKYAQALRQGYSVTVHHADGTSTTQHVPPNDSMSNDKNYNWYGDRVNGDKIGGDKIGGDKVLGNKITHYNSQNLAQAAQEIKSLLDQLDRDYDRTTPTGQAMISAQAIASIEKNPTLKARIINALKEGGTTALEEAIDHPAIKPVVALLKGFMDA
ncbi:MAG TPA: hypothetical protein V6C57_08740 [Coleofasciculaceae cyanobacterium]